MIKFRIYSIKPPIRHNQLLATGFSWAAWASRCVVDDSSSRYPILVRTRNGFAGDQIEEFPMGQERASTWNACIHDCWLLFEESGFVRELIVLDLADLLLDSLAWSILEPIVPAVCDTPVLIRCRSTPCAVYSSP